LKEIHLNRHLILDISETGTLQQLATYVEEKPGETVIRDPTPSR